MILFEVDTVVYCLGWKFKLLGLHYGSRAGGGGGLMCGSSKTGIDSI